MTLILAFGPMTFAQASLIEPGKSAGVISLGMARAEVIRRLGQPTQSWTLKQNTEIYSEDVWCRKQPDFSYYFTVITNHDSVAQIELSDPRFKTVKGFSTSDTFSKCRSLYPHMQVNQYMFDTRRSNANLPSYTGLWCEGYYVDDVRQGFAVTLRSQCDKVDYELPWLNPDTIVIHRAGAQAVPMLAGKWAAVEPRYADDYLDQIRAWFAGGVYRPRSAQQILDMQKKAEARGSK